MSAKSTTGITTPRAFRAAGGTCGIKPSGQPDLALIVADTPCPAAGMFTMNKVKGAPVLIGRRHLRNGTAQAIVCNSGVANVANGPQGLDDARLMCTLVADRIGGKVTDVLPSSTGVIGHRLPMNKIEPGIDRLHAQLARGRAANAATAHAILTTDKVTKSSYASVAIPGAGSGRRIRIAGIAKGSGMIAPNMATMLSFITTDASISSTMLDEALKQAVQQSFNRISVDNDTSTSDTVLILASGMVKHQTITRRSKAYQQFSAALTCVCQDLAYQIVQDGEGVTRVIRVVVNGARTQRDAERVGRTVVDSPLVKTAAHGADPNWGRILMALGRSGATVKLEKLSLYIGEQCVFDRGQPILVDDRRAKAWEAKLALAMQKKQVLFRIDLGLGRASTQWFGGDLSREYIAINADYTT